LVPTLAERSLPACVRLVVIGGEKASEQAYRAWKRTVSPKVRLLNSYGPTEATITATCFEADFSTESLPIGRPVAGTQAFIVDKNLRPVKDGCQGELCLAGPGLARGYRNQPRLTAERFIPNPFHSAVYSPRLYKTGDLVRRRSDSNLEFLGRLDDQIKIRGFRVEPSEVEAALHACPGINAVVVTARESSPGVKRLVAYYVVQRPGAISRAELVKRLQQRLPRYMLPAALIELPRLPLTLTGKVDRHALPEPGRERPPLEQSFLPPRTSTETRLAAIWSEVLRVDGVGLRDNFFELGGDSLLATRIVSRIRASFGTELALAHLYEGQTIERLSQHLEGLPSSVAGPRPHPATARETNSCWPAAFVQERMWILHALQAQSDACNMSAAFEMRGELNLPALGDALFKVCQRHESLRTTFRYHDGQLVQLISPPERTVIPLVLLPKRNRKAVLEDEIRRESRKAFALEKGPLFRIVIFKLGRRSHVLALVMHHIVSDGWSLGIFLAELEAWYNALRNKSCPPHLPELPIQYRDFAAWRRESFNEERFDKDLAFWKNKLAGARFQLSFPDPQPLARAQKHACRVGIKIPRQLVQHANQLAQNRRTTLFTVMLTALGLALREHTSQTDFIVGTVVAGRNCAEVENLIGCFINFLPLRLALPHSAAPEQSLGIVGNAVREAQSHQDCPFEKIVAAINPERGSFRNPLYNVALLWHEYPSHARFQGAGLKASPIEICPETPQLDLRFEAEERQGRMFLDCEFDAGLFTISTIDSLLGSVAAHLVTLTAMNTRNATLMTGFLARIISRGIRKWKDSSHGKAT